MTPEEPGTVNTKPSGTNVVYGTKSMNPNDVYGGPLASEIVHRWLAKPKSKHASARKLRAMNRKKKR